MIRELEISWCKLHHAIDIVSPSFVGFFIGEPKPENIIFFCGQIPLGDQWSLTTDQSGNLFEQIYFWNNINLYLVTFDKAKFTIILENLLAM